MYIWFTRFLLLQYIMIAIVAMVEKRWVVALYWIGACILQISIMIGLK